MRSVANMQRILSVHSPGQRASVRCTASTSHAEHGRQPQSGQPLSRCASTHLLKPQHWSEGFAFIRLQFSGFQIKSTTWTCGCCVLTCQAQRARVYNCGCCLHTSDHYRCNADQGYSAHGLAGHRQSHTPTAASSLPGTAALSSVLRTRQMRQRRHSSRRMASLQPRGQSALFITPLRR